MPENRDDIDTFKITFFASKEGLGVGNYDEDEQGIFFTGIYDDAVKYGKSFLKEEWREKVDLLGVGSKDFDSYGCDTTYFNPETGDEITEEEAKARDYEVTTEVRGFNIYQNYPEKKEQIVLSSQRKKASRFKEGDKVKYIPNMIDKILYGIDIKPGTIGTVVSGGMGWGVHPDPIRKYVMVEWENGDQESVTPDSLERIT